MIQRLASILVLAASTFFLPAVTQAQFHTTDKCNNSIAAQIAKGQGNGDNGEIAIRVQVHANYKTDSGNVTMTDLDTAKTFADALNGASKYRNDILKFQGRAFDIDKNKLNLTFYYEIYMNSDNTYNVFLSVNGWGVGHLFNIHNEKQGDVGDAVVDLTARAETLLADGWTCSN